MAKKDIIDYGLNNAKVVDIKTTTFFNDSLRLYSAHSNVRGIPFIGDGFKEAQRKAMWGMLSRTGGENAGMITVERVSAHCAACFVSDTPILLADGTIKTIGEIVFDFSKNSDIFVQSFDEKSRTFVTAKVINAFMTKFTSELIEMTLEDDSIILVTPEHLFLTARGWVMAKELNHDDNLISK